MPLNKQNGNMYSWVTHTWNPLAGRCPHECVYCSTEALIARNEVLRSKYAGEPRLAVNEMRTRLGKGNTIFVCNMTDLFARGVLDEDIMHVLNRCRFSPDNTYLFQTKNPARFLKFTENAYPRNVIFCTTIETDTYRTSDSRYITGDEISLAPLPCYRQARMIDVKQKFPNAKISVTIEPIMDFDEHIFLEMLREMKPDFVSIGADSKRSGLPEPSPEKVQRLIDGLQKFTKIERKSNLARIMA